MSELILSPEAEQDLIDIWAYIAGQFKNATISLNNFAELGFDATFVLDPITILGFDIFPRLKINTNLDFARTRAYRNAVDYQNGHTDRMEEFGL